METIEHYVLFAVIFLYGIFSAAFLLGLIAELFRHRGKRRSLVKDILVAGIKKMRLPSEGAFLNFIVTEKMNDEVRLFFYHAACEVLSPDDFCELAAAVRAIPPSKSRTTVSKSRRASRTANDTPQRSKTL